ncbi:hypothetical protein Q4561_03270 [Alteromonas sp. 1_MG-2023]|uniref:hypothetical protein n=1 Tax=Alteromonas sp. 1_MG-2023 TaxID=3062669 RepID=UPI0026E2EDDB|nr:hypothetical protein [Alteromonas sp. 1_MG-2023]MDO6566068.1 hypothetical protein [Alteromonas sp. 1_MG-2023]
MNDENEQFRHAYQQSKSQYKVPSRIKRSVLNNASGHSYSHFWQKLGVWHKEWFAFTAAAFVLVLLIGIYDFKSQVNEGFDVADNGLVGNEALNNKAKGISLNTTKFGPIEVTLEVHGFKDEIANVQVADYSKKYTAYSRAYEQQLATFKAVSTRVATLTNVDNQWTLVDCTSKRITLSDSLVASMREHQRIATGIEIGDQVALAFNQNGFILNITRSTIPKMC